MEKIDGMGGAVAAIEAGWIQDEIAESAFRIQQAVEAGDRAVVGVNRFQEPRRRRVETCWQLDEAEVEAQIERVRASRPLATRRPSTRRSAAVRETARGTANLLPPMREALRAGATLGEVSDVLRGVFGEYHSSR